MKLYEYKRIAFTDDIPQVYVDLLQETGRASLDDILDSDITQVLLEKFNKATSIKVNGDRYFLYSTNGSSFVAINFDDDYNANVLYGAVNSFNQESLVYASEDELESLDAYVAQLETQLNNKQNKTDDSLSTSIKNIVGAINEVHGIAQGKNRSYVTNTDHMESLATQDDEVVVTSFEDQDGNIIPLSQFNTGDNVYLIDLDYPDRWVQTGLGGGLHLRKLETAKVPLENYPTTTQMNTAINNHHDSTKQNTLVSGSNIKTINGNSIVGSGNITISTTGSIGYEEVQ